MHPGYVSGHNVNEDYNAQSQLIPFPSHDGAAVVDFSVAGAPIYFDKVITFDDKDSKSNFEITFDVMTCPPKTDPHVKLEWWIEGRQGDE